MADKDTVENSMTLFISKYLTKILCALFAISLATGCVAVYFYQKYFPGPILPDHAKWGMLGDFFGGTLNPIFSLLALLALLLTIIIQSRELSLATEEFQRSSKALESQSSYLEIQNFERRFFELLKIHRENVSEMTHKIPTEINVTERGRRVFLEIRNQFKEIFQITNKRFSEENFDISKHEKEIIEVAYIILVFGVGGNSIGMLHEYLNIRHKKHKAIIDKIIEDCVLLKSKDGKTKKFGGHLSRLGHYFRHLYHMVTYVDTNPILNKIEKYKYVKILRAQFSVDELFVFFINSISMFGEAWEFDTKDEHSKLITEYQFIKNLPIEFTCGIKPETYYPSIEYERY